MSHLLDNFFGGNENDNQHPEEGLFENGTENNIQENNGNTEEGMITSNNNEIYWVNKDGKTRLATTQEKEDYEKINQKNQS